MINPKNVSSSKYLLQTLVVIIILSLFSMTVEIFAQQDKAKAEKFKEVDKLLLNARALQADLLSPENYKKALDAYQKAQKDYDKGKDVDNKLVETKKWLELAAKTAKRAGTLLKYLMTAREDALDANATEYAQDIFDKAERLFSEATKNFEKGKQEKAEKKAKEAEQLYREAELLSIKKSITGPVREKLTAAEKKKVYKLAPKTMARAKKLLEEAEAVLNSDRSAKSDAKIKAEEADYEISHAEHISGQVKELKRDDLNWEKLILTHEGFLKKIANSLSLDVRFDKGLKTPTLAIVATIKSMRKQIKDLNDEIARLDQDVARLEDENSALKTKLEEQQRKLQTELTRAEKEQAELRKKIAEEERRKQKIKKIESMFDANEAKVFREGDNITIRLIGLKFASGKSVINPSAFELLTKVQRAIRIFPDYHITIAGHTDNRGDARKNKALSQERAKAVRAYLMANMDLDESKVSAVGFGESTPIASNETAKGRAQNRRIEIILSPTNQ